MSRALSLGQSHYHRPLLLVMLAILPLLLVILHRALSILIPLALALLITLSWHLFRPSREGAQHSTSASLTTAGGG
eukprot:1582141-Pyramimonas_sp.AAC.1